MKVISRSADGSRAMIIVNKKTPSGFTYSQTLHVHKVSPGVFIDRDGTKHSI